MNRCRALLFIIVIGIIPVAMASATNGEEYLKQRKRMVKEIEGDVKVTSERIGKKQLRRSVMKAMSTVPRHEFVPKSIRHAAYVNRPLPIGYGQTISQPYIVALMTDLLDIDSDDIVLEVGTGSGYQAAVLAKLARFVFSVERLPGLARSAKQRLDSLGYENISVKVMDGTLGWRAQAPYQAIIVTAAAPEVPELLLEQLAEGGRLVVPVGSREQQVITIIERRGARRLQRELKHACFVPLVGRFGWEKERK